MIRQLNLFKPVFEKKEPLLYRNLNINQRINVRSNSLFPIIYYKNLIVRNCIPIQLRDTPIDLLTKRYWTHYYLNAGVHVKLNMDNIHRDSKTIINEQVKLKL